MIQLLLVLHRPTGCSFIRFDIKHYISVCKQKNLAFVLIDVGA